jgi:hypothetical protein
VRQVSASFRHQPSLNNFTGVRQFAKKLHCHSERRRGIDATPRKRTKNRIPTPLQQHRSTPRKPGVIAASSASANEDW